MQDNEDPRYWICDDPPAPDGKGPHDRSSVSMRWGLPFGTDTVGIVDEMAGGIIVYVHKDNAAHVLSALSVPRATPVRTTQTTYNDH